MAELRNGLRVGPTCRTKMSPSARERMSAEYPLLGLRELTSRFASRENEGNAAGVARQAPDVPTTTHTAERHGKSGRNVDRQELRHCSG